MTDSQKSDETAADVTDAAAPATDAESAATSATAPEAATEGVEEVAMMITEGVEAATMIAETETVIVIANAAMDVTMIVVVDGTRRGGIKGTCTCASPHIVDEGG